MRYCSLLFKAITFFFASIAFSETAQAQAQAPEWKWARADVANYEAIVNDSAGNLYVAGNIWDSLILDGDAIPGDGKAFVAKFDPSGGLLWVKRYGNWALYVKSINLDKHNNIYLAGIFTTTLVVGSDTIQCNGESDIFVVKLDSTGDPLWARGAGGKMREDFIKGLGTDGDGNVYIAGMNASDTLDFGNLIVPTGASSFGIFLAKYDTTGNTLWAKTYDGPSTDFIFGVTADADGNVYCIGGSDTIAFDATVLPGVCNFVTKHDKDGNFLWARPIGTTGKSTDIAADKDGNVYIAGSFFDTLSLGSTTLIVKDVWDALLVKLDRNGVPQWAKSFNCGSNYDDASFVTTDRANDVYIGARGDEEFVGKFSPDGTLQWLKKNIIGVIGVVDACVNHFGEATIIAGYNGYSLFDNKLPVTPGGTWAIAKFSNFATSVEQPPVLSNSIQLYPNPAATTITIDSAEPYDAITIVDVLGRVVIDQKITVYQKERVIDVSSLSPGVYVVQLKGRKKTQVRFVKE